MAPYHNILLIQLGDIGDVVLATSSIRAVKEAYPVAKVSIMVRKPFGNLLAADPHLHEVVESVKPRGNLLCVIREYAEFVNRLRKAHYDMVIDFRTGDRSAILSFLTGARVRIGRHRAVKPFWRSLLFTELIDDPPHAKLPVHPGADQTLRIVRALGMGTKDLMPKLYVSPDDREHAVKLLEECGLTRSCRWISINPCSRWKYKEWGYEKWGEIIDWLWREYRFSSIIIGAPEDKSAAEAIVAGRATHTFNLAGKTSLGQLAALLGMSFLQLGIDSAAAHIAAAVGTPTVTIFGPGNWRSWTVADDLHRVVTKDMQCIPCNSKGCENSERSLCLEGLDVKEVIGVVDEVLSKRKATM